jgi:hypothetical protein
MLHLIPVPDIILTRGPVAIRILIMSTTGIHLRGKRVTRDSIPRGAMGSWATRGRYGALRPSCWVQAVLLGVAKSGAAIVVERSQFGIHGAGWFSAPSTDWIGATLAPGLGERREVLAVRDNGADNSQERSGDDVERVMAGIHNPRHCNKGCRKDGHHDQKALPGLAAVVHDMELSTQPQGSIEKSCKGGCHSQVSISNILKLAIAV